jgi:hypothetical protein
MAITLWPTFSGQDGEPEVSFVDSTIVQESQGGGTFSISEWPDTKRRYAFRYNGIHAVRAINAPGQDYHGLTELQALVLVRLALSGRSGRIYVADPLTGQQVLCELESDEMTIKKVRSGAWWRGEVSFLSVLPWTVLP